MPDNIEKLMAYMKLFPRYRSGSQWPGLRIKSDRYTTHRVVLGYMPQDANQRTDPDDPFKWLKTLEVYGTRGSLARRCFVSLEIATGRFIKEDARYPKLMAYLRELWLDPELFVTVHGKNAGMCCFCGMALSTPESTTAGYGPHCAKRFGLPWGFDDVPATFSNEDAEAEADVIDTVLDFNTRGKKHA